jgi:hypothetical protein
VTGATPPFHRMPLCCAHGPLQLFQILLTSKLSNLYKLRKMSIRSVLYFLLITFYLLVRRILNKVHPHCRPFRR